MSPSEETLLARDKYGGDASKVSEQDRARLAGGEPLAYVIGWIPFLGLRIALGSKPLIPRPETEWWTETLATRLTERGGAPRVLDLCAGSGAIGCALLKGVPGAQVSFGELEPAHEETIRENIRANGLPEEVEIGIGDLFAPFPGTRFDFIASNPPYIPAARELAPEVAAFEPALALRAGADGLALIRRIAEEAPEHVAPGGELWLEVDASHAEEARDLVAARAERAELRTDQYGRPRLVVGYF